MINYDKGVCPVMKKLSVRLLAILAAMTMLLSGCSEGESSSRTEKNESSSSSSQNDSSSDKDTSDGESSNGDESAGGEQTTADTIPWDYEVPDPNGNTESKTEKSDSDSSRDDGSSSSDSKQENTTTAATTKQSQQSDNITTTKSQGTTASTTKATTKPTTKQSQQPTPPKPTPTPSGTPVQRHGALHISGNHIVDSHGKVFMLQGMSTHGIMWSDDTNTYPFSGILSTSSLKVLRDDWKCNAVRIAMYTEEWGGYTQGYAAQAKQKVIDGVANATSMGMYVIIDWHILKDGNPQQHQSEAIAFFSEMASRYKNYSNVIFELCNEPNGGVSWGSNIKPYCEAVVKAIRGKGAKNLIICGTGTWSQDIHQVLGNKLSDSNCAYTLHFYANTHTDWLRQRLEQCYNSGLPVLVTEFGTCDASGNGGFNESQTRQWYSLLARLKVGWFNWSAASKNETASAFKPGTNLANISAGEGQLTQSGKLIRNLFRANASNAA